MSTLLKEIRLIDPNAARQLEKAKYYTDSDIQTLTREDLHELLPGRENLRLRKTIFDKIHARRPIHVLLKELKNFIPQESFRAALTDNGVLVDYLPILKDMKNHIDCVQEFLSAHIDLLENISKTPPEPEPDTGLSVTNESFPQNSLPSTSASHYPTKNSSLQTFEHPKETRVSPSTSGPNYRGAGGAMVSNPGPSHGILQKKRVMVRYQKVVSGKTFDADRQLLERVIGSGQENDQVLLNLEPTENDEDCDIIIVFCPIASRVGTDIEAAMKTVTGNKSVIQVLMHHSHEPKPIASMRTWTVFPNVVLSVSVFYHETKSGLLTCQQNSDAISAVRRELVKHSNPIPEDISGNAPVETPRYVNRESYASEKKSTSFTFSGFFGYKP